MIQRIVEEKRIFITLWTTYIYIYIFQCHNLLLPNEIILSREITENIIHS